MTSYAPHQSTAISLPLEYFHSQSTGDGIWSLVCNVTPHNVACTKAITWIIRSSYIFFNQIEFIFVQFIKCSTQFSESVSDVCTLVPYISPSTLWYAQKWGCNIFFANINRIELKGALMPIWKPIWQKFHSIVYFLKYRHPRYMKCLFTNIQKR